VIDNKLIYHWYDEPNYTRIVVKENFQRKLIRNILDKERFLYGSTKTLAKKIGVNFRTVFRWQSSESRTFYVKDLKAICDYAKLSYDFLEKKKLIESLGNSRIKSKGKMINNPKLPFILSNENAAELVGFVLSDGCISTGQNNFIYAAGEKAQLERVKLLIDTICGNVEYRIERESEGFIVAVFPPTIGRMLIKSGLPFGEKTLTDCNIPKWVKKFGTKEYLRAVLTDEGHFRLRCVKTKRHKFWSIYLNVTHGRSRDITTELFKYNKKLKRLIKKSSYISYKRLPHNFVSYLEKINPPKLLSEEKELLENMNIKTTSIKPMRIIRTKGNRFTCYWRFSILKQSIPDFYNIIGFTPLTKKQKRFESQFKNFIRFRDFHLTDRDILKYNLPKN